MSNEFKLSNIPLVKVGDKLFKTFSQAKSARDSIVRSPSSRKIAFKNREVYNFNVSLIDGITKNYHLLDKADQNRLKRLLEREFPQLIHGRQEADEKPSLSGEFSTNSARPVPEVATRLWKDRPRGEAGKTNPVKFIKEEYGEWIGNGLTRAAIGKLDPDLYQAYAQWISPDRHPADRIWQDNDLDSEGDRAEARRRANAERQARFRERRRKLVMRY